MSEIAIRVEGLGKQYRIGARRERYKALRDTIADVTCWPARTARSLFSRNGENATAENSIWALKDVSFEIKQGDVLGVIGRNGAGKSTLLKILSRITEPTKGRAEIHGRVASLLEVGTGFHPELTGRENIYLNGAILGMARSEIRHNFDEIVAFADVDKFLDTPVKHYSSGMHVRLAFAVAAHLEPEILVVDEVLAVGDAQFQKKCLGKMGEVARGGRTVLFVSHNLGMIYRLCKTAILLEGGHLVMKGDVDRVVQRYTVNTVPQQSNRFVSSPPNGSFVMRIVEAETVNGRGEATDEYSHDERVWLNISCVLKCPDPDMLTSLRLTVAVVDRMGRKIFTDQTGIAESVSTPDSFAVSMGIPVGLLTPGNYTFIINANVPPSSVLHRIEDVCSFSVTDTGSDFAMYENGDLGCVLAKCDWHRRPHVPPFIRPSPLALSPKQDLFLLSPSARTPEAQKGAC